MGSRGSRVSGTRLEGRRLALLQLAKLSSPLGLRLARSFFSLPAPRLPLPPSLALQWWDRNAASWNCKGVVGCTVAPATPATLRLKIRAVLAVPHPKPAAPNQANALHKIIAAARSNRGGGSAQPPQCHSSSALSDRPPTHHPLEKRLRQLAVGVVGVHRGLDVREELLHLLQPGSRVGRQARRSDVCST